jgi:uncharacterized C2H2 Zn-finger protein
MSESSMPEKKIIKHIKTFELNFGEGKNLISIAQIVPINTIPCDAKISVEDEYDILNFFYFIVCDQNGDESVFRSKKDYIRSINLRDKIYFTLIPKPIKCFVHNEQLKNFILSEKKMLLKIEYAATSKDNATID